MIFTSRKRQLGRFGNSVSSTGSHTPPSSRSRFSERSGRSPPQRSPHAAALILSLRPVIMFQIFEIFPTVRGMFNLGRCSTGAVNSPYLTQLLNMLKMSGEIYLTPISSEKNQFHQRKGSGCETILIFVCIIY